MDANIQSSNHSLKAGNPNNTSSMSETKTHRINEDILKKALAKEICVHENDVKIENFDVSGGAGKGDNFNSVLNVIKVKATARGKNYERSYMAKSYPMSKAHEEWLREVLITVQCCIRDY